MANCQFALLIVDGDFDDRFFAEYNYDYTKTL
jgi:hypothetical protein